MPRKIRMVELRVYWKSNKRPNRNGQRQSQHRAYGRNPRIFSFHKRMELFKGKETKSNYIGVLIY